MVFNGKIIGGLCHMDVIGQKVFHKISHKKARTNSVRAFLSLLISLSMFKQKIITVFSDASSVKNSNRLVANYKENKGKNPICDRRQF